MSRSPKSNGLTPRKTATQTRATKTVEAIIEGAAHILETVGFDGYTTNAIAERAGVSIGSLYQYFANKDAITLALIAREASLMLQDLTKAQTEVDWREALNHMVAAAVRHQLRRPALARLLDIEEGRLPVGRPAASVSDEIYAVVRSVVAAASETYEPELESLTADVIGITRGMTDMAGNRHEADENGLVLRVHKAVTSYLTVARTSK